ncbi:unnamed protein product [Symbiodinium pilosum]|uniref:TIR domain-containing protein n=1 Tax=Symbiodinium pilosum TaxID=2952 RepID=A0A812SBM5_SYMPI|nr:unnamed protein product [Symbiodinium pilosum]
MIGHLTFIIFICFWQRIREVFKTPHIVFLDKLCISQEDQILKEKGILGLAAFLSRAETLLVLWSPRYFRRLWCTYELATFLNLASKSTRPRKIQVWLAAHSQKRFAMPAVSSMHALEVSGDAESRPHEVCLQLRYHSCCILAAPCAEVTQGGIFARDPQHQGPIIMLTSVLFISFLISQQRAVCVFCGRKAGTVFPPYEGSPTRPVEGSGFRTHREQCR